MTNDGTNALKAAEGDAAPSQRTLGGAAEPVYTCFLSSPFYQGSGRGGGRGGAGEGMDESRREGEAET